MEGLRSNHAAYAEYMDDFNYSQGFYVTTPEDGSVMMGGIRRVGEYSDDRYLKAEHAAIFAVGMHNSKAGEEGSLTFGEIVNLNVEPCAGATYYITAAMYEADGEVCVYQLKIWEKLNSGYQIQIFRPAPYHLKSTDKRANTDCRVTIYNLMPWMDENYLYYKCFLANTKVVGVKVIDNEEEMGVKAYVWLRNSAEKEEIVNKYKGRKMPHSNIYFTFDSTSRSKF